LKALQIARWTLLLRLLIPLLLLQPMPLLLRPTLLLLARLLQPTRLLKLLALLKKPLTLQMLLLKLRRSNFSLSSALNVKKDRRSDAAVLFLRLLFFQYCR
jgi:hypothetical protein